MNRRLFDDLTTGYTVIAVALGFLIACVCLGVGVAIGHWGLR